MRPDSLPYGLLSLTRLRSAGGESLLPRRRGGGDLERSSRSRSLESARALPLPLPRGGERDRDLELDESESLSLSLESESDDDESLSLDDLGDGQKGSDPRTPRQDKDERHRTLTLLWLPSPLLPSLRPAPSPSQPESWPPARPALAGTPLGSRRMASPSHRVPCPWRAGPSETAAGRSCGQASVLSERPGVRQRAEIHTGAHSCSRRSSGLCAGISEREKEGQTSD